MIILELSSEKRISPNIKDMKAVWS